MFYHMIKRIIDFVFAFVALILIAPLFILLYFIIRVCLGAPVIFKQARPGRDEKIFYLYKFRTMSDKRDHANQLLPDAERLTRLGKFLRSLSLDELPTLFNVLKGEMSLVGPRPLLVVYLPYYSEEERIRHSVRPGITGWAQVNGRNQLSWGKKFQYDIWYVKHQSFSLDVKILLLTIVKVMRRENINAEGQATMHRFDLEKINEARQSNDTISNNEIHMNSDMNTIVNTNIKDSA